MSGLEPLTRMGEHAFRKWVTLQCFSRSDYWQEWVNMHPASELLSSVWANQNHWWECVNTCPASEFLFSAWVNQNYWQKWVNTGIQKVSCQCSPVFGWIRTTDKNGWTHIQRVSCSLVFKWDQNHWHKMGKHIQHVSYSWVFEWIRTIDKNWWTCI